MSVDDVRARLAEIGTCTVSDALDKLGINGVVTGIAPTWPCARVAGRAVTVKITAAGPEKARHHLGSEAIDAASPGDVIVVDNAGHTDVSCWGGILATGARARGVAGIVIDGACRDADEYEAIGLPVFTRGVVPCSARGRVMQESFNSTIRVGSIQVRPGDYVLADSNGIVFVPAERIGDVLREASALVAREQEMLDAIAEGASMTEVDRRFRYESMLRGGAS